MGMASRRRLEIQAFCRQHQNEDVHTEYVTQLALTLFDAVNSILRLPARDRILLEAAGLLHDVGYAADPEHHMQCGVNLVRAARWQSFSLSQTAMITAIMSLHQKSGPAVAEAPALAGLKSPIRAARLGAILRIADGLDQSHIQDACIKSICIDIDPIIVRVKSHVSPQNVVAANQRSNLWHEVFPVGISFIPSSSKRTHRLPHLKKSDHPLEYFRRYAYRSLKGMRENEEDAIAGEDREALHDLRVQNRRFRTLLQMFRKPLVNTDAEAVRQQLADVASGLGPARDRDVWLDRLKTWLDDLREDDPIHNTLRTYWEVQKKEAERDQQAVRTVLSSPAYRALLCDCTYFLRITVPECIRQQDAAGRVDKVGAEILKRQLKKLRNVLRQTNDVTSETGHELRKHVRRSRYVAETFAPVLDKRVKRLGCQLRAVADALGQLRDAELGLARIQDNLLVPPLIRQWLREEKEKAEMDAWKALQALKLRR